MRRWTTVLVHRPGAVDGAASAQRGTPVAPFARRAHGRGGAHDPGLSRRRGALAFPSTRPSCARRSRRWRSDAGCTRRARSRPPTWSRRSAIWPPPSESWRRHRRRSTTPTACSSRPRCSSGSPTCRPCRAADSRTGRRWCASTARRRGRSERAGARAAVLSPPSGAACPSSAFGQTKVHDRLGPRSPDGHRRRRAPGQRRRGSGSCEELRAAGIPFIGVRGVVAGASHRRPRAHRTRSRPGCWRAEDAAGSALTLAAAIRSIEA